jgi:hypothetical protein
LLLKVYFKNNVGNLLEGRNYKEGKKIVKEKSRRKINLLV